MGATKKPRPGRHRVANAVIVVVLALHAATFFTGTLLWPVVDYPMYQEAHGPEVDARFTRFVATLADGREVVVDAPYLGISIYSLGWNYEKPMLDWEQPWVAAELAGMVAARAGQPVAALEARLEKYRIGGDGLHKWHELVHFDLRAKEPGKEPDDEP